MKKTYFIIEKLTTFKLSLLFVLFSFFISSAQVTTNSGSGLAPTYPDLATAITALNGATITSPVVITLTGNETAPVGGYAIIAQGDATNTIIIEGVTSTITANATLTAGTFNDAIFKLIGADYVTIRNFTIQENLANTTTTAASNNMTEWGIALLYASVTNGAQNNTIQNNTITLNRTYQNTFGIYSNSTHTATAPTTSATATGTTGGNSGLRIYANNISNVNNGVVVVGPTAAADHNTGIDIGGSSLSTANTITDYGTTGTFSTFANVSGTVNGILVRNSYGFNISYNTITSSAGGVTVGTLNGIQIPVASNLPTATFTNTISYNNISLRSGLIAGGINGISTPGAASATSTLNIVNNNFNNFGHTTASATGSITFINNISIPAVLNVSNNTFTNLSLNTTGVTTFVSMSYSTATGTGTKNVTNNSIVTGFTKTAANGNVICITDNGSSVTGTLTTVQNNNFSNITVLGTSTILGINLTDGGTAPTKNITGNVFNNWSGVTGAITAINITYWNGVSTLSNNTITNITSQSAITGINMGNTVATATSIIVSLNTVTGLSSTGAGGAVTGIVCANTSAGISIFDNVINTFSTTGASAVNGITISGANAAGTNVYKHKIYSLSGSNAGSTVNGINITGGALVTVYNNIIGGLTAPIANAANPINGINITGGTTVNAYYNTVMLNATSSGALFGSSAINVSSTPTVTLINNIFVNNSTVTGAGLATAYRRSSTTLTTYGSTSNNNLFFGSTIFTDGTNTDATLAAYKARVSTRDAASVTENPTFVSTLGTDATYLHINTVTPTFAEGGASVIAGVSNDFDGDLRSASTPDIGADEFNGVSNLPACTGSPSASTTNAPASVCSGSSFSITLGTLYNGFTGISFQWQSSPDGVTYSDVSGAISNSLTVSQTAPTYYQCIITCTNGGGTTTSTPVQVLLNDILACYCAATYTSGGATDNITNVVLNTLSNNTTAAGNPSPNYTYYSALPATNLPQGSSQTLSVSVGTHGTQWTTAWIDWNRNGVLEASESIGAPINPGASGTAVFNFTVPAGASLGLTRLRIRGGDDTIMTTAQACGATNNAFGETEDYDVNIVINPICTGAPVASNTTAPASVCSGTNFNLGLSVVQVGTGYTYQWQSSPDGIAPYVDISGQTATTATLSQTVATYYQCVITCTGSGLTTISTPIQVNMNSVYACYCASTYGSGTGATGGDAITNVTLGTLNNSSNAAATATPSPYYTFYNAVTIPDLTQGSGQTISISFGSDNSQFSGVWIDYNKDGDLLDAGEFVANSTVTAGANGTSNLNFTVPVGASLGNTLMRIRGGNDSALTDTPCGASSSVWGETEDYIVNITACVAPAITTQPAATVSVCENTAVNLSVVATGTGLTYQWKKDTVDIPSATSATYSIPSALVANSGSYTVLVTGACGTILSNASTVTVTANSTLPTEVVSVCDTYTWAANGTTYTTSGIYTNVVNCVTRTLDLTITPSSSLPTEVVSVCDTYTWAANGTTYTTSGIYTNVVNCVTRTLDLTITPSSSLPTEVVSVCDTYTWAVNGTTYTTSGIYTNVVNCVTRTLDLTITPSSSLPTEVVSVCDTYTWSANGTTYTTSGIYTNVVNCVTRTLDLTITPSSSLPNEVVSACDSYTWSANGTTYTTSGTYTNVVNCVTRTLNLTINASTTTTTNVTVCDTYTWPENGLTYTVGGTYTNVTTNGAGCPNTATLNLVVTNASIDFANLQFPASATICEGGTMTAYGQVYEAGLTEAAGQAAGIDVEFGYNTSNTNPNTWSTWTPATFNVQVGNNDEYMFTTSNALTGGTYYYTFRYRLSGCSTWQYGGDNNGFWNGTTQNSGVLTINAATISGATTQVVNEGVAADATIEDIVVTSNGTVTWFASASDAASNSNPLPAGTVLVNGNIYYGVTNIGACRSTTLAVTVTVVLGNTSFDLSQLSYYPNPVRDIFNVKYSKEIISVDVFDLTGRNVINIKPNALNVQVNMTNLSSAMYIVRLQSVDGIKELKVYKN